MNRSEKLFWAPNVNWKIEERSLIIGKCEFAEEWCKLFPEFYFLTQDGIEEERIGDAFPEIPHMKLVRFIKKLMELRILVSNVQDTYELFYRQYELFDSDKNINHEYFLKAENVEEYRMKCISRPSVSEDNRYCLKFANNLPSAFTGRRSIRNFNINEKISRDIFESILSASGQYDTADGKKYCYPSAGGLYPIDMYIHVKKDRIEGIEEGLYYFDSVRMHLDYVSSGSGIDRMSHYALNRDIYEKSAFSVYLFFNTEISMPKYQSRAYLYAFLDAGILAGYLQLAAQHFDVGSCSIGDMKFSEIKSEFHLSKEQIFLHCIEFGLRR